MLKKSEELYHTSTATFYFGPNVRSAYKAGLGKTVYKFSFQVEVRFGDKGENLRFNNLVEGKMVSQAVIKFDKH